MVYRFTMTKQILSKTEIFGLRSISMTNKTTPYYKIERYRRVQILGDPHK